MNLAALSNVDLSSAYQAPTISSDLDTTSDDKVNGSSSAFETMLQSASNLISETNDLSNAAEEQEVKYSMGETDNLHDVQIAQEKANVSLQYCVSVRDAFVTGYKELMNLQF